ncbi:MAG: ankyrin repeat domain-containing protein [Verrucomicrobiota bacterium]
MSRFIFPLLGAALVVLPVMHVSAALSETPASLAYGKIIGLLSDGKQGAAEDRLAEAVDVYPDNEALLFLHAVCTRSRFDVTGAGKLFLRLATLAPRGAEGQAAACILGVDFAANRESALYYFSALCEVARRNPDSLPIRWMTAVMVRALTLGGDGTLTGVRGSLLGFGIAQYEGLVRKIAPKVGPCLVHQTYANLLDEFEYYEQSYEHRLKAIAMERKAWALDAMACTLMDLGRYDEAIETADAAFRLEPDRWEYLNRKAKVLVTLWRFEEYAEVLCEEEKIAPAEKKLPYYCARELFRIGQYERAAEYAKKAVATDAFPVQSDLILKRIAVRLGEPGASEVLAAADPDTKPGPKHVNTPHAEWFLAAWQGDKKAFDRLVDTADLEAKDPNNRDSTALILAAQSGATDILEELIRRGANLNAVDKNGDTALNFTAQFIQPKAMELLLEAGADPYIQDKWKQTPLISCAGEVGNLEGVRVLLKKGVSLEHETPHGGTALRYAAAFGRLEMVRLLLAKGANREAATRNFGDTPLIATTAYSPHPTTASELLRAGVRVNAQDKQGRTTLSWVLRPQRHLLFLEMLLAENADPNIADKNGITPVQRARYLGWDEDASILEAKSGVSHPFVFPEAGDRITPDSLEWQAALLSLPVSFAQGVFLGKTLFVEIKRDVARKELRDAFGLNNAADLTNHFKQSAPSEAELNPKLDQLKEPLRVALAAIRENETATAKTASAWVKANRLYVLTLGKAAGYSKAEEADEILRETVDSLRNEFHSWEEYQASFLLGVTLHAGWDRERYGNICRRLMDQGILNNPWVSGFWKQ